MQLRFLLVTIGAATLLGCGEPQPYVGFDAAPDPRLSSLPGVLSVRIRTATETRRLTVEQGKVSSRALPEPRTGASADTSDLSETRRGPGDGQFAYRGPSLLSPDGKHTAAAVVSRNSTAYNPSSFVLIDAQTQSIVAAVMRDSELLLDGFAWSPDSRMIAVLYHRRRASFQPRNILSALSGHPVAYNDYTLDIFRNGGQMHLSVRVATNMVGASGDIVWEK